MRSAIALLLAVCVASLFLGCEEPQKGGAPAPATPATKAAAPTPMATPTPAATPAPAASPTPTPSPKATPSPTTKAAGPAATPAPAGAAKEVVLEAKKLTLKDCELKALEGATGGKAVLMDKDSSEAKGTVDLKKGKYKVVVYAQGASSDEDAVFVTIGDGRKTRVYAQEHGKIVPANLMGSEDQFFTVTIDKDGRVAVLLTMAEKNVYVDRVVFTVEK